MTILIGLIYNFSIIVSVCIVAEFVHYRKSFGIYKVILMGCLMGGAAIIGMTHPVVLAPGLIFDGRSVILSITGVFFGPIAGLVAGVMALGYRTWQGGSGALMGAIVIITSTLIGSVLFIRNKKKNFKVSPKMLLGMGIAVHILMICAMFALPLEVRYETIRRIGLPVIVVYPITTVLIGLFLIKLEESRLLLDVLQESQNQLMLAIDNAPIPIMLRTEDGEVLKISRKWTEITGYSITDIPTIDEWTKKAYGEEYLSMQQIIQDTYTENKQLVFSDYKVKTADGSIKIWHFNTANIGTTTDGRQIGMTAAMDISELKKSEEALKKSEEKYRFLTEYASDVIWILNLTTLKFTYISPSIWNLRGLTVEEALNEKLEDSMSAESLSLVNKQIAENLKTFINDPANPKENIDEIQQPCKNGEIIWVEVSTKFRYNEDGEIEVLGVSRNINERKKAEMSIKYLSYHDQLTGLYNRRFYEEELQRLDQARNLPMTIVMADVNGLKLVNDSFGHTVGDELLRKVAQVLKTTCRTDDIVARFGGDEFIILLPNTDEMAALQLIARFEDNAAHEKVGSVEVSVSFGFMTKISEKESIQSIFKKAEDAMYKKKLYESPVMRGKIIKSIMEFLNENNKIEERHFLKVSQICFKIGEAMALTREEQEKLRLVGLVHDIGKIGIDEKIFEKTEELTDKEWEEVKRHPEIGYRILSTVNDMSEMAEIVLAHHERWDGTGYPRGLQGEEIPLASRIIMVADAYDAMTSRRSYRTPFDKSQVIDELKNNAGKQFDPNIVTLFIKMITEECDIV